MFLFGEMIFKTFPCLFLFFVFCILIDFSSSLVLFTFRHQLFQVIASLFVRMVPTCVLHQSNSVLHENRSILWWIFSCCDGDSLWFLFCLKIIRNWENLWRKTDHWKAINYQSLFRDFPLTDNFYFKSLWCIMKFLRFVMALYYMPTGLFLSEFISLSM